jgi:hypothetical protein
MFDEQDVIVADDRGLIANAFSHLRLSFTN